MRQFSQYICFGLLILLFVQTAALADSPAKSSDINPDTGCAAPDYPPVSRILGEQGAVELRLLVAPDGSVAKAEVNKSSGFPRLDTAALEAISQCRFKRAVENKPASEPSWSMLRYDWRLKGTPAPGPKDHKWYAVALNRESLIVVDEYSTSAQDDVVSFVESHIFYNMTSIDRVNGLARRLDAEHQIDCKLKTWRVGRFGFVIDDNNKILAGNANTSSANEAPWAPIASDSVEAAAARFFCLGEVDKKMVRKDSDLLLVQQAYLRAAKAFQ